MTAPLQITDWKACSIAQGQIIAPGKDKRVRIGSRTAIIKYDGWASLDTGPHPQVALDFASDSSATDPASPECEQLIAELFSEVLVDDAETQRGHSS